MNDDNEAGDLSAPLLDPTEDARVAELLGSLPPVAMPDDVATSIEAALAAEIPLSGPVPSWAAGGSTNVSVLPTARERDHRRSRRGSRLLSAAAVVALIAGTVVVGTQLFDGADQDATSLAGGGPEAAADSSTIPVGTLLTTSGATYSTADLDSRINGLVAAASAPNAPLTKLSARDATGSVAPSSSTPAAPSAYAAADVVQVDEARDVCLSKLVDDTTDQPVAVDSGQWESTADGEASAKRVPAAVFVLADPNPRRVEVYVVSAACADPTDPDAHVLYFAFVTRP